MGIGASQQCVLVVEIDLPVPERAKALARVEECIGEARLPVTWKPTGMEEGHEGSEGKGVMSGGMGAKPCVDAGILETV